MKGRLGLWAAPFLGFLASGIPGPASPSPAGPCDPPGALPSFEGPEAAVRVLLENPEPRRREGAAWAVGARGSVERPDEAARGVGKGSVRALTIALYDPSRAVRRAAACSLGRIGDARALEHLAAREADGDAGIARAAAWARGRIRSRRPETTNRRNEAERALLIRGVTLIGGTGAAPRPDVSILVEGRRISAVGPQGSLSVPPGVDTLDARGRYAVPGLWDAHVHLSKAKAEALPVLLSMGITSVRDMGGDLQELWRMERSVARGELPGPRMWIAGPMLERPATIERMRGQETRERWRITRVPVADTLRARAVVDSLADLAIDFVKIREARSPEVYAAIVHAARRRGLAVAGHAPFEMEPLAAAELRVASFEHASYPYPLPDASAERRRILEAFRDSRVTIVPTFVAWRTHLLDPDSVRALVADTAGVRDPRMPLLSPFLLREWHVDAEELERKGPDELRGWWGFYRRQAEDIRAMHEADIPIVAGSDLAGVPLFPGWALHDEVELLVELVGLSPMDAIASATRRPAELLGAADSLGTIEPGKLADLVLLDADPLEEIAATRRIFAVVADGRLYSRGSLRRLRDGVAATAGDRIPLLERPPR